MQLISVLFLLAIAISTEAIYCPGFFQNQTTCSCEEYLDGAIIKCSGKEGPLVVEQLKNNKVEVRELWLEHAKIIQIGPDAFKPLKLKKLVLDNNPVKIIDKNAFRGLESSLQDLSLATNKLSAIPTDALDGLRALNVLNLRCNNLGNLTEVAFMQNPYLIEVNLACNQICSIGSNVFSNVRTNLQNLILDNNCFDRIPTEALQGMEHLVALHMKNNKLAKLGSNELVNVTNLSMVTFTSNQIETIEPDFVKDTNNIRYIYLNENKVKNIVPGTFKQFNNTEVVDLSYNELSEVTENMFSGLENLQHLNLEANQIRDIAPGAFVTTPLLLLWLPYNCLSNISPNMFQGALFLKQISLAHNNIRTITPLSFAHLANLHTLDLSNNKIGGIENGALTGTDFMTVRLQENPFVCTQDGFHVLNGQEAINLTTEANVICHEVSFVNNTLTYLNGDTDQCPRRKELPARQPCCLRMIAHPPTTPAPYTVPSTEATTTASTTMSVMERARERARKLNMERFLRLSRPPVKDGSKSDIQPTIQISAPSEDRARQRTQSYRSQLLPYLRNEEKNKSASQPQLEFSQDAPSEQVQAAQ
ncbi:hypothetical protein FO519_002988 [Halicephalobus sp. NKZ332]|nr:hypothetical protein FO519_002988 [Halicephalobus sp. NKZ332]